MAASLFAKGRATAAFQPLETTGTGNVVSQTASYSLTADASANDVFQMMKLPNGAKIIDGFISLDSSDAFTFAVGDGGSATRFITSASVSGSATGTRFNLYALPYQYSLSANANPQYDTIDVKLTAVTATVALNFNLTVWYLVDGQ